MGNMLLHSAIKLHDYLYKNFWNGHALVGPDPGLHLELRFFRFLKSYLSSINWHDNYYFLQAQGYWVKSNWGLFEITGDKKYKRIAITCSKHILAKQHEDGSWEYPLKAWKKYVSTVEGTWASLGLLETFKRTNELAYLDGAMKWYDFLINKVGFQEFKGAWAINYFDVPKHRVPNNTTLVLWFFAELYEIQRNSKFLKFNDKLIKFIQLCQGDNGEIRYSVEREHYLCYHYNAFEFLDLYHFYRIIADEKVRIILKKIAKFLSKGVTEIGSVKYDCFQTFPEKIFYSAVVGAALTAAMLMGLRGCEEHVKRLYDFLLKNQNSDGSFMLSRHDSPYLTKPISHGFLVDKRSYPRPLTFILQHLLFKAKLEV